MIESVVGATRISGSDACRRVLLVGELNPLSCDPRYALYHEPARSAGGRLQRVVLGVRPRTTYLPMWRTNLCVGAWDADLATARAAVLCGRAKDRFPWRLIVALGVRVSDAFGRASRVRPRSLDVPVEIASGTLLISIPHPSGRGYGYNDPAVVRDVRALLARAESDVPWGELGPVVGGP